VPTQEEAGRLVSFYVQSWSIQFVDGWFCRSIWGVIYCYILGFRSRDFGRGGLEGDFFERDTLVRKQLSTLIETRNINILNLSLCDWGEKLGALNEKGNSR
jgi:hypothetical protein